MKLTKRSVEALKPGERDLFAWDDELAGFGLRLKPSGVKTFIVQYRAGRRTRRLALGRFGVLTPEEARKAARRTLGRVIDGEDPSAQRREARTAATVAELCDRYLAEHAHPHKKPISVRGDERNIVNHVKPLLGALRARDVTKADIDRFKRDVRDGKTARNELVGPRRRIIVKGGAIMANRCLALLSKMFNLAERWGLRPDGSNPCRHIGRYRENRINRFLSETELKQLGDALAVAEKNGTEAVVALTAIRLLALTGCRRGEILALRWVHVDLANRCLRLPDSKTGAKIVPLGAFVCELLTGMKRHPSGFVLPVLGKKTALPGRNGYTSRSAAKVEWKALADIERPWRRICKAAGLIGVRLHDLRHSFASIGAIRGHSLLVIGNLLGHRTPTMTSRYAHLSDDPLHHAADTIAGHIGAAMSGKPTAPVIPLRPTAAEPPINRIKHHDAGGGGAIQ